MRDVTARRALEDQPPAAGGSGGGEPGEINFLATMSHEIRTPLNGVLGMAQAMAADKLSAAQRDRLEVIRQSGEALLAILNDVLDLSKIEAGRFSWNRSSSTSATLRGAPPRSRRSPTRRACRST